MSPWFQAKLWDVRAGMNAHVAGVGQTPPDVEKKNQSGSANNVKVGVRNGSAVTMCRVASSTGSTIAWMMLLWTELLYGFSQLRAPPSRASWRTAGSVRPGLPVT